MKKRSERHGKHMLKKRRVHNTRFEELQMMKFTWRNNIGDLGAWNSAQVEEIDYEMKEYEDMLAADQEFEDWNKLEDKFYLE